MIRILILFLTLNAIFPSAVLASICVCDKSKMHGALMQDSSDKVMDEVVAKTLKHHCDHPEMAASTQSATPTTSAMHCDSGCCDNCLGVSAVTLTSLSFISFSHPLSIKPISGDTTFYTRIISPETRPPLV